MYNFHKIWKVNAETEKGDTCPLPMILWKVFHDYREPVSHDGGNPVKSLAFEHYTIFLNIPIFVSLAYAFSAYLFFNILYFRWLLLNIYSKMMWITPCTYSFTRTRPSLQFLMNHCKRFENLWLQIFIYTKFIHEAKRNEEKRRLRMNFRFGNVLMTHDTEWGHINMKIIHL